jgi:predicted lysophospholipase L1 biosynthesis ABC-type transport system permease subunit
MSKISMSREHRFPPLARVDGAFRAQLENPTFPITKWASHRAGEFALTGAAATLIGVGLRVAAAFPMLINVVEAKWALPWNAVAVIAGLATGVSTLGPCIVERSLMSEPPWRIPRAS